MPTMYLRLSEENHGWLSGQSAGSGISMTRIVDDLISEARENGGKVDPMPRIRITKEAKDGTKAPRS